jgi:hypothetical protein
MSLAIWSIVKMMSPFYSLDPVPPSQEQPTAARTVRRPAHLTLAANRVTKPLRVARVPDDMSPPDRAGRMVMSGRMDEVCAELDRLVQLESRRQAHQSNDHSTALAA